MGFVFGNWGDDDYHNTSCTCDGCAKQVRRIKIDGEFPKGHTIYIGKCRFVAESEDGWFYPQQLRDGSWEGWR